jgi:hypothetical protein
MSYTITKISSSQNIGDSLDLINQNYSNLSNWIIDVQNSYNNTYQNVYNFFIQYVDRMDETLNLIHTLSSEWQSFQTTVETNSAKWLQPYTIWYPKLISIPFTDSSIAVIKNWLQLNFPIRNDDGSVNYVENQQFIVNAHTYRIEYKINNAYYDLYDYTLCYTHNTTIYAYCSDIWANNYVACSNGGHSCGYSRSCSKSATSDCYYQSPYYRAYTDKTPIVDGSAHTTQAYGKIEAKVTCNFTDRIESSFIKSISFKVIDCDWVFDKFIT